MIIYLCLSKCRRERKEFSCCILHLIILGWQQSFCVFLKFSIKFAKLLKVSIVRVYKGNTNVLQRITKLWAKKLASDCKWRFLIGSSEWFYFLNFVWAAKRRKQQAPSVHSFVYNRNEGNVKMWIKKNVYLHSKKGNVIIWIQKSIDYCHTYILKNNFLLRSFIYS